ncbi:MAG: hypothetical protein IKS21_04270 [Oscillospiraceae bacterium]|nr:hypothetical protein [Oscillospiraceae bacterium]
MAIIRAELKGEGRLMHTPQAGNTVCSRVCGTYEAVVELASDLSLPRTADFDPGSVAYCLENHSFYVKNSQKQWETITA